MTMPRFVSLAPIYYQLNGYMLKTRSKSPLIFPNIENTDINANSLTKDQQVTLLKRKLVETHNKLIAQLDRNREQELKIFELSNRFAEKQSRLSSNQPIRSDLEALRTRLLAEMLEKNKSRDQLKAIMEKFQEKQARIQTLTQQISSCQQQNQNLQKKLDQYQTKNQQYSTEIQKYVKAQESHRIEIAVLKGRNTEIQRQLRQDNSSLKQHLETIKQLNSKISSLTDKIQLLEQHNRGLQNKFVMDSKEKALFNTKNAQIQKLTAETNRLICLIKEKDKELGELRQKLKNYSKKRQFDETRHLIMKLDEAQMQTRHRQTSPKYEKYDSGQTVNQYSLKADNAKRQLTFETLNLGDMRRF